MCCSYTEVMHAAYAIWSQPVQLQFCPASRGAKMRQQALLACLVNSRKVDKPHCFDAHSGCLPLQGLTYQRHETLWRYCRNFLRQGMCYLSSSFLFGGASPHFPARLCSIHAFAATHVVPVPTCPYQHADASACPTKCICSTWAISA